MGEHMINQSLCCAAVLFCHCLGHDFASELITLGLRTFQIESAVSTKTKNHCVRRSEESSLAVSIFTAGVHRRSASGTPNLSEMPDASVTLSVEHSLSHSSSEKELATSFIEAWDRSNMGKPPREHPRHKSSKRSGAK